MSRIYRNPDVLWRRESDEIEDVSQDEAVAAILFSGGSMLSVNEFGLELWELCDGKSVDEMVASLLPEFDVAGDVLQADILDFLDSLSQKGFIRYE
jgi:GeoRSP system PqqD family protein